jgi:hypothetical protein
MAESIRGCADFQALFPAYRAGSLPEARAMLLQDHLHECVACRRAFAGPAQASVPAPHARRPVLRYVAAALALLALGFGGWLAVDRLILTPHGPNVVQSASGMIYRASGGTIVAGQEVPFDAEIRTAKDSSAVIRLRDGSTVEMAERSGFSVSAAERDLTVHLASGSIIVHAAKSRAGHCNVRTRDCTAAGTGAVFSVTSGDKGSRVSVIEGEAQVTHNTDQKLLRAGEQFSTSPTVSPVPVKEDVAWAKASNVGRTPRSAGDPPVAHPVADHADQGVGSGPGSPPHKPPLFAVRGRNLGIPGLKEIAVEQEKVEGKTTTHATLSFDGPRQGIAALLARPAPIGALDFISPEAMYAAAFAIENPAAILDQLFKVEQLAEIEAKLGVSIRNDLAAPLGGNFAVALDGPMLPVPSWKLAVEVYDTGRLQSAIEKLVQAKPGAQLSQESAGGRTYYKVTLPEAKPFSEAHYTFVDGYLLTAPNRSLLDRAIQYRSTGYTLPRSAGFTALVPRDRYTSFSGVVYYDMKPVADQPPALIAIYGEEDRVILSSTADVYALNPAALLGILKSLGPPHTQK